MRKILLFFSIVVLAFSCSEEKTVGDELVGDWLYERETFNSFTTFEDPDTEGYMSFREDETGNWSAHETMLNFSLEWDLQANDEKIAITKYIIGHQNVFPSTTIYDITRTSEDKFTFTFHFKTESVIDTIEPFEQFENIILTRME